MLLLWDWLAPYKGSMCFVEFVLFNTELGSQSGHHSKHFLGMRCFRERRDGMSAKWEALLRCRRHRTAVQHLRSDLQVCISTSRKVLHLHCVLRAQICTSVSLIRHDHHGTYAMQWHTCVQHKCRSIYLVTYSVPHSVAAAAAADRQCMA